MRQEWIERTHDQARMEMGYCVQDGRIWCSSHDSGKVPGAESCNKMDEAYRIAESAGEVVEELARADERAKAHVHNTGTSSPDACCECCYDVPSLERDHFAARRRVKELVDERDDLRAKVGALPHSVECDRLWWEEMRWHPQSREDSCCCLVADVLALLPEKEKP